MMVQQKLANDIASIQFVLIYKRIQKKNNMQTALAISQIIFYSTFSLAVIVLGALSAVVVYQLVLITRQLEKISRDVSEVSAETKERIQDILDALSRLPFLSFVFGRSGVKKSHSKKSI